MLRSSPNKASSGIITKFSLHSPNQQNPKGLYLPVAQLTIRTILENLTKSPWQIKFLTKPPLFPCNQLIPSYSEYT